MVAGSRSPFMPTHTTADRSFNDEAAAAFTFHKRLNAMMLAQAQWANLHSPNDSLTRGASPARARRFLQSKPRPS
jgi:hypothetical protein